MDGNEIRLRNTFSFWATLIGGALAIPPETRRVGAVLLLLAGYGGAGVAWERAYQCDLRRVRGRRPPVNAVSGFFSHLPLALAGHVVWQLAKKKN